MKKITAFILLFAMLLTAAAITVAAKSQEKDTFYLDNSQSIVIAVSWDKEKPAIIFIDPKGKEYDPQKEAEGTSTVGNDKSLYYIIENAPSGQWRVRYDKGKNEKINIELHEYKKGLLIESFNLGTVDGTHLPVTFKVSGEENVRYSYRISAMIDHTGVEKTVAEGSATVGDEKEVKADLSALSTYSAYMLKLYVWYNDNGTDIFDFMFSPKFEYTNTSNDEKAEDFTMTVCPEESLLYVSFGDLAWQIDGMIVAVFEDGAKEPVSFDEYDRNKKDIQLAYDPGAKEVAVEVSYKCNGTNTAPVRKTADLTKMAISVPEGKAFNSVNLPMTYKGLDKQLCAVTVNGYVTELVLTGDGQASITLGDDWNTLRIEYLDKGGVTWIIEKEIFVDRKPPVLNMSQNYDGMAVSAGKISISGTASDCTVLEINGKEIKLDANGNFKKEIKLTKGENTVTVTAKDALGNETRYTAGIYSGVIVEDKEEDKQLPGARLESMISPDNYFVLITGSAVCLLIVLYAVIFWHREKEKSAPKAKKAKKRTDSEEENK